MRILHVTYQSAPKRLAPGGGDLGMFQNLTAMAELGHEVHLAILGPREHPSAEVRARTRTVHEIAPAAPPLPLRLIERLFNPETFALRFPSARGYARAIDRLARELRPDVIWADTIFPLAFAPRTRYPVVFGNYDFLFKLKTVRRQTRARKLRRAEAMSLAHLERFELTMAREAAHVMCVSASESEFLRERAIASTYIPIVGPTIMKPEQAVDTTPRLFLFGNHNTAHAAALHEIRHQLRPALDTAGVQCEWHQVGRAPAHPDEDWKWMERTFDHVHGFVDDLSTIMRPGDLSIMPYRFDTGFRTKFAVAAGYGVASVGYVETFRCAPEFTDGVDCIAATAVDGLVRALARARTDRAWRMQLGTNARSTYERAFTFEAQIPRYAEVLGRAVVRGACKPAS
jgi:hypothetical protein